MWTEVSSSVPHFLQVELPSEGVMSGKQTNNNRGLCPFKGQQSGPCSQIRLAVLNTELLDNCQCLTHWLKEEVSRYGNILLIR